MRKHRYTKEILQPLVQTSVSIAEVCRKLGLSGVGGSHSHISRRIVSFDICTKHFLGIRANSGKNHKGPKPLPPEQILVVSTKRIARKALKKAMLAVGFVEECGSCEMKPLWQGKELVLPIDHINGNNLDNRRENLRFLCPNCHSQTSTFCGRSAWKNRPTLGKSKRTYKPKKRKVLLVTSARKGSGIVITS